jgi:hypothetical protein
VSEVADADTTRIERLAGLCRVWGTVKFLHPYLAYKDIDWDEALIAAIPRVRVATSAEEYRMAIAAMLAMLQDPATTTTVKPDTALPGASPADDRTDEPAHQLREGVAIIDCARAARLLARRGFGAMPSAQELGKAKGVTFDCRGDFGGRQWYFRFYLCDCTGLAAASLAICRIVIALPLGLLRPRGGTIARLARSMQSLQHERRICSVL